MIQTYKKNKFADRKGKLGDLPTEHLPGGVWHPPLHPTLETGLEVTELKENVIKEAFESSFEVFANNSMVRSTFRESKICFSLAIASKDSNLS